ncbi:MAG: chemotaxis protein CheD [Candidatus Riflebacteria bacterium]|nr:chemotaxis protein CheD [Candidatus Riflebacteria bacterium]
MNLPCLPFPRIFLKPCQIYVSLKPAIITTVLGSCVSIVMFHQASKVAAISHSLLPHGPCLDRCVEGCQDGFKFVDCSIKAMYRFFGDEGINIKEIRVKVFGGGDVTISEEEVEQLGEHSVGKQNVEAAFEVLESFQIYPIIKDIRGTTGRKIIFFTHNGDVYLKRIKKELLL